MVTSPAGVREISVPWHEIIAVALFDTPMLNDGGFADSIVKDRCDVHVFDLVVVLVRPRTDFDTSDEDVFESSGVPVCSDGIKQSSKVFVRLDVESSIPLPVGALS